MTAAAEEKEVALNGLSEIHKLIYLQTFPYIQLVGHKLTVRMPLIKKVAHFLGKVFSICWFFSFKHWR